MRIAYVHELEDKVNRLEAILRSLGRRVEDHIQEHDLASSKRSAGYSSQPAFTPHTEASRDISQPTDSPGPATDSSWSYTNGPKDPQRHLPEPMSVRSVVADTSEPRATFRPRSYTASTLTANTKTFSISESELPPYDMVYNLVDLFFKHINPWSPILGKSSSSFS